MIRPMRGFAALALLLGASAASAQEPMQAQASAQEIPKEANVIIARTKLAPSDAYRAAMQGLVTRGYTVAFSDPLAMVASTAPFSFGFAWDLKVRITFFVATDANGTHVRFSGWYDLGGPSPIDYRGQSRSAAMKAWLELEASAKLVGDAGLEYRKESPR
jgi:hypothetical protein